MYSPLLKGLMALLTIGVAAATAQDTWPPVVPSEDPWYTNPANISLYKPGEVISHRQVSSRINGALPGITLTVNSTQQYLYRTTDSLGHPVAAVMTLLVPHNPDPTKLLNHQTAYDSVNLNCAPSYSLRLGANYTALADIIFIAAALNQGWYVATADFHGLYGQFTAGLMAGHSVLDSVRVALAEGPKFGLSHTPRYGLFGYSGGSIGIEWALELQQSYAPELNFAGAALGGLAPNITKTLMMANGGGSAGLVFAGMQGLSNAYPNLTAFMQQHMIPSKLADYQNIGRGCLTQLVIAGADKNIFDYIDGGEALIYEDIPQSVMKLGGIAGVHGVPKPPVFVWETINDELSPIADTDALIKSFCDKGATIEYHRDSYGDHVSEAATGGASAFEWLTNRLNGKPLTNSGCVTKNVYMTSVDSGTYAAVGRVFVAMLESILSGGWLGNYTISG